MILHIEDNPGDVVLLQTVLAAAGHQVPVRVARTHTEALEALRTAEFTLVVVDLRLPGPDGWDVLAMLAEHEKMRGVPVSVLTSSSREDDRARAAALGVQHYFVKPGTMDGYTPIVAALMSLYGGAQ